MSQIKAIAAMAHNRVIGVRGSIPWRIPDELRWFKEATTGHAVVMGRKTYESLGRPLPNRRNIVISRSAPIAHPEVITVKSPEEVSLSLVEPGQDLFVIGGGEIYSQLLPQCSELLLTVVPIVIEGDTFFPAFEPLFRLHSIVRQHAQFEVRRYERTTEEP